MPALDARHALVAFGAALFAGAMSSVAGGGTLLTFPALIWLGLPSITANATSTVAIWPGSLGSVWGYRREQWRVHTGRQMNTHAKMNPANRVKPTELEFPLC